MVWYFVGWCHCGSVASYRSMDVSQRARQRTVLPCVLRGAHTAVAYVVV
jgi:hypothetical protein